MLRGLAYLVVNALVLLGLSYLISSFEVTNFVAAIIFVVVLTALNWTVLPVLKFFAFPFNILTLGLVNGLLSLLAINLAIWLVDGVNIIGDGWTQVFTTLIIAVVLAVSSGIVEKVLGED